MRRTLLAVSMLLAGTSAFAQSIDQQGADALTANLKRFVGQTAFDKKIVTVDVDGDGYKLGFDFKALTALFPKQGEAAFNIAPYALKLKPRSDGTWDVSGDLAPNGSFAVKDAEGKSQNAEWSITGGAFSGVFDPAISYFSSASGGNESITFKSVEDKQQVDATFGKGTFELTGKAGANGGVDITQSQTLNDFVETVSGPAGEGLPDMAITLRAPKLDVSATGAGFRVAQFLDILAFGVANGDEAKIKTPEAQAQLKQLLLATLPLWDRMSGKYSFNDFVAETPYGAYGAGLLGVDVAMDGIGKTGTLDYGFTLSSLKIPDGIAPAWSVPILPTDITLHFGGANLNLEGPARKFIEAMEIGKEPPVSDAVSEEIKAEFLAYNPKMTLTNTSIRNKDTEFTLVGEATFPNEKPDVTATIEASGFDKLEDALKIAAGTDPTAAQAFPAVLAAKGFAKTQPDGKLQWIVEAKPDGSVLVNGTMLKGPDVVEPAEPADPDAPAPGLTNPN